MCGLRIDDDRTLPDLAADCECQESRRARQTICSQLVSRVVVQRRDVSRARGPDAAAHGRGVRVSRHRREGTEEIDVAVKRSAD